MRLVAVFGINVVLTALTVASVGPAAFKMEHMFGLIGWAGRLPFYMLQLYIAPATIALSTRKSLSAIEGGLLGMACTVPLVFWSIATHCIPSVQLTYALSGFA